MKAFRLVVFLVSGPRPTTAMIVWPRSFLYSKPMSTGGLRRGVSGRLGGRENAKGTRVGGFCDGGFLPRRSVFGVRLRQDRVFQ